MCLICIEYSKGKLQPKEALRNLKEMKSDVGEEHYKLAKEYFEDRLLEQDLDEYWLKYQEEPYEFDGFGD